MNRFGKFIDRTHGQYLSLVGQCSSNGLDSTGQSVQRIRNLLADSSIGIAPIFFAPVATISRYCVEHAGKWILRVTRHDYGSLANLSLKSLKKNLCPAIGAFDETFARELQVAATVRALLLPLQF